MGSIFTKGSGDSRKSSDTSLEQIQLAREQFNEAKRQARVTEPLRVSTAGTLTNFLQSGRVPSFLDLAPKVQPLAPLAALSLPGMASEQQILRNQLMAQGNRGGLLQQQLAQAAIQGGIQRTDLQRGYQEQDILRQQQRDIDRSGIARTLFGGAADLGTGGLSQAFAGMTGAQQGIGTAANNLNTLGAQRITQNQIAQQGIGQILGKVLGAAGGAAVGGAPGALMGSRVGSGQAGGMK